MEKKLNKREIVHNVGYAFAAQLLSLLISILSTLFIPKVLGITEFGFWQLFLFYASYSGCLHFGLYDGIYLKLGGKKYNEVNTQIIGTLYYISITWQLLIVMALATISIFVISGPRLFIILVECIYLIIYNTTTFAGLLQQAVNQTKKNSISIMIERFCFLVAVIVLLTIKNESFQWYVIIYVIARLISLIYYFFVTKRIFIIQPYYNKRFFRICFGYCKIGMILTLANLSSMLILGVGRFFIDQKWGIETFGKISFAITMTHFVLIFINQVGIVLFPALRQCDNNNIKAFYVKARKLSALYFPIMLFIVYPIVVIVQYWLPKYLESIPYFFVLVALCIYDGRMQMLYNTVFKVLRMEKKMFLINFSSALLSVALSILSVYLLEDVNAVVFSMLIAVCFRSFYAEWKIANEYNIKFILSFLLELILVSAYIVLNLHLSFLYAGVVSFVCYIIYFFIQKNTIRI